MPEVYTQTQELRLFPAR